MPFNGSGVFILDFNWANDLGNTIPVTATRMDDQQADIALGLGNTITKDGQSTITANIPFAGFKLTGVGTPTSSADAATKSYVDTADALLMLESTYDPTAVAGDAFDMDLMVEGALTKIFTDVERSKLGGIEPSADITDETNVAAANAVMDADFTQIDEVFISTGVGTFAPVKFSTGQILGKDSGALRNLNPSSIRTILNIEDGADVTDEANVTDALDGATLVQVVLAANDKILLQNASSSDELSWVDPQEIADLSPASNPASNVIKVGTLAIVFGFQANVTNGDFISFGYTFGTSNPTVLNGVDLEGNTWVTSTSSTGFNSGNSTGRDVHWIAMGAAS